MSSDEKNIKLMRDGKISTALLKLGLPLIIAQLISTLYNVVDTYFVSGLGTSQVAAVSVAFPIGLLANGIGMMFGAGAASYISRLLGAGEQKQATKTAATALFSSILVGIIAVVISLVSMNGLLIALGATDTILPYARAYAVYFIIGSIFTIFNAALGNIIIAEGASQTVMIGTVTGAVINIILDPIFIYTLNLGVAGAAIATVIGTAVVSLIYLIHILRKKGVLNFSIRNFSFDMTIYGEVIKIGLPLLIYHILSGASIALTNNAIGLYGDSAVAAMGIVLRIFALGTAVMFGFGQGFQPVAGFNYGAKQYNRLNETIRVAITWTTIFCVVAAVLMFIFAPNIISLFSKNDIDLITIGSRALRINGIAFAFFGFEIICATLFLALGKGAQGGILTLSRQGIFFIPVILILPHLLGLDGVLFTQFIADILTVILSGIFLINLTKQLKKLKAEHETESN